MNGRDYARLSKALRDVEEHERRMSIFYPKDTKMDGPYEGWGEDIGDEYADRAALDALDRQGDDYMRAAYPSDFECCCSYSDADYCPIHGMYRPLNLKVHPEWADRVPEWVK